VAGAREAAPDKEADPHGDVLRDDSGVLRALAALLLAVPPPPPA